MPEAIQQLCFEGQKDLLATDYLSAEDSLVTAEHLARDAQDWDSLARLYMPLQEARRQRRQRAGEGVVKLDLVARHASDGIDVDLIASKYLHGQLLVAGFGSIEPAQKLRQIADRERRYLDVYLAASYWVSGAVVVAIVPNDRVTVPTEGEYSVDELTRKLPPHSILMPVTDLPAGERMGDTHTFAQTMSIWEKLHRPFLAMADQTVDPESRIEAYRQTIEVDYACELAHQKLSETARMMMLRK
jgi:hypothetical protein